MNRRFDRVSLAAGAAIVAMGAVLWLEEAGDLDLSANLVGALFAAVLGVIVLISGLDEDGG